MTFSSKHLLFLLEAIPKASFSPNGSSSHNNIELKLLGESRSEATGASDMKKRHDFKTLSLRIGATGCEKRHYHIITAHHLEKFRSTGTPSRLRCNSEYIEQTGTIPTI